jgi:predicted transcriptional regulator
MRQFVALGLIGSALFATAAVAAPTDLDMIARAVVDHGAAALQMRVEQLMSKMLFSCGPDDDLRHVLNLMVKHNIRHIPVLSEHVLVGLISASDIIELRLKEFDSQPGSDGAQTTS